MVYRSVEKVLYLGFEIHLLGLTHDRGHYDRDKPAASSRQQVVGDKYVILIQSTKYTHNMHTSIDSIFAYI